MSASTVFTNNGTQAVRLPAERASQEQAEREAR